MEKQQGNYPTPNNNNVPPVPPPGAQRYPQPPPFGPTSQKTSTGAKVAVSVAAVIGVLILVATIVGLVLLISSFNSCVAAFSDEPIGDSRETKAFIESSTVTARDLEIFDALRGSFESIYASRNSELAVATKSEQEAARRAVSDYRAQLETGRWPSGAKAAFSGPDFPTSPQLWVRIAELSQDYLQDKTGETWRVVDFAYPFPNNGPIPVPPRRDAEDCTQTVLLCESGPDAGLCVSVSYYRWTSPAVFKDDLENVRKTASEIKQRVGEFEASGLMEGRTFMLANGGFDVFVWSRGSEDPLRDAPTFQQFASALFNFMGRTSSVEVHLLETGTPCVLQWRFYHEYPNSIPAQWFTVGGAQEALAGSYSLDFEYAPDDCLYRLMLYRDGGQSQLSGALVPSELRYPWGAPQEGSVYDGALAALVASFCGVAESDVIALSYDKSSPGASAGGTSSGGSRGDKELAVRVVVPRGALPETPDAFAAAVEDLSRVLWNHCFQHAGSSANRTLRLRVYVVDPEDIATADTTLSFADMHAMAQSNPASLGACTPRVRLVVWNSVSAWKGETEPGELDWQIDLRQDVDGSVCRSREWYLSKLDIAE